MNRSRTRTAMRLAAIFFSAGMAIAQVPGGDFETWAGSVPTGWVTSNNPLGNTVTQSATAHGGLSSAQLTVILLTPPGTPFGPTLQTGAGGHGFSVAQRYAVCSGYYQFAPIGGDRLTFTAGFYKGGASIGIGANYVSSPAASWTQFQVTIGYTGAGTPDTCIINVSIIGPNTGTDYHVNSTALVDDITLSGTNAVEAAAPAVPDHFALEQNFPNPFNPSTEIRYSIARSEFTTLTVYDLLGREVANLVKEVKEPGTYTAHFDAAGLASGVYYYRLTSGVSVETHKMLLVR
jgi:hypothetical protein